MNPSVEQIERWTEVDANDPRYVRMPASAYEGVLYVLGMAEKLERSVEFLRMIADGRGDDPISLAVKGLEEAEPTLDVLIVEGPVTVEQAERLKERVSAGIMVGETVQVAGVTATMKRLPARG